MRPATIILISFLLLTACTRKTPAQRLTDFISDPKNKIVQSIETGGMSVRTKYYPVVLAKYNPEIKNNNQDLVCFNIRFDKPDIGEIGNEKMLYLNFDMQKDFVLQTNGKALVPVFCQRIENGMKGSYEYMLAFDDEEHIQKERDFTLLYTDKIFGIGAVSFVYNHADIARVPES